MRIPKTIVQIRPAKAMIPLIVPVVKGIATFFLFLFYYSSRGKKYKKVCKPEALAVAQRSKNKYILNID